jgi:hypothetical protein
MNESAEGMNLAIFNVDGLSLNVYQMEILRNFDQVQKVFPFPYAL